MLISKKTERQRLYQLVFSDGYALRMPALDQAEEQAIHVSIRPEDFIKDESGSEGTISDSVYLGLNAEYFIGSFASKFKLAKNQLLKIYKRRSYSSARSILKLNVFFLQMVHKTW